MQSTTHIRSPELAAGDSSGGLRRASAEPEVQLNKWGFLPGGDDTLDLNLMHKGGCSWALGHTGRLPLSRGSRKSRNAGVTILVATECILRMLESRTSLLFSPIL